MIKRRETRLRKRTFKPWLLIFTVEKTWGQQRCNRLILHQRETLRCITFLTFILILIFSVVNGSVLFNVDFYTNSNVDLYHTYITWKT